MACIQHFTRSQASKLNPNPSTPSGSLTKDTAQSTPTLKSNHKIRKKTDGKPSSFLPFAAAHYSELKAIWGANHKIPTLSSRRAWAQARELDPIRVDSWFFRRKLAARKAGVHIPTGAYELPVGTPQNIEAKEEQISLELQYPRKRMKANRSEDSSDGSRTGSPTLTLSVSGTSTPGSSDTTLSPRLLGATETRKRRAYNHSFDIPTDLFLDPTLGAEEITVINAKTGRTAPLTVAAPPSRATSIFSTCSDSLVKLEDRQCSQDASYGEGSTSPADCLCVLCTSPAPEFSLNETLTRTLTLADLSLLYDSHASSTPVLSFQLPTSDHPNGSTGLSPSSASASTARRQVHTPDLPLLTELSAIPFLCRLLATPIPCDDDSNIPPRLDCITDLDGDFAADDDNTPFMKIHLRDDPFDFLPSLD